MNLSKYKHVVSSLAAGGLLLVGLILVLRISAVRASPGVLYVSSTDRTCGGQSPCYTTIQSAEDAAANGDVIKVATGTYTDIHARAGITQVVYISKTVTIQGGYTTTNWTTSNPISYPTTLDAQRQGRVLYITGDISPTVEGLRITGGDATGLGGSPWGNDAGGGVYLYTATATISDCVVVSNTASTASRGYGGGLFLVYSHATLNGNTVITNTASTADSGSGGGVFLSASDTTLGGNTVINNTASTADSGSGGGLSIYEGGATLSSNTIVSNTASTANWGEGGGLYVNRSGATLNGNTVQGNTTSTASPGYGGGLFLLYGHVTLSGNTIVNNTATLSPTATARGGGLWIWGNSSSLFTLTNNIIADNHANTQGSGLYTAGDAGDPAVGHLLHNTIADNRGSGQGVYVAYHTTLAFTNTIIAGHASVGITVTTGSMATLEATLWYNNGSDTGGGGTILTGAVNVYDAPVFVDPSAWDYHLAAGSAAIDAGVDAGVTTDIDGESRDTNPDIGADECAIHEIYLPLVLRNY